ncbi:MAG: ATP-binding protein [Bacilli bacterium]|nr:ATP-binding protein [Bacilli bacterium]MDD4283186.1 ATP-binding protein [Bacilli bacterium]MDD4718840.1 ATP-binding protein [Bacilli bacterium]
MFGKIVYISDNLAHVKIADGTPIATNLMNLHVMFEDKNKKILGEIEDISSEIIKIRFLGEIVNDKFVGGVIRKPTLSATIRVINPEEISLIIGKETPKSFLLGYSPLYDDYPIHIDVNELFSNHLSIFGNSGSGKSYGVARILQNIFLNKNVVPFKSNFFVFDAYGEYHNAFVNLNKINSNFNFKVYTTNTNHVGVNLLKIPIWLLGVDEIALLLSAESHGQLPIIERMLKLVRVFAEKSEKTESYKNHLIAKAIMAILYTNQTPASKRNDVFSIIASCSTEKFNLEAPVNGVGYVRKFRECFTIDSAGNFTENVLLTSYITQFINDEIEKYIPSGTNPYSLEDLERALEFTLISEGLLRNEKSFSDAITLKVRLHSITIGEYAKFFEVDKYISKENFIAGLVSTNGKKAQIVNFNLEDVEDWFGKFVTKLFAKLFFDFTKSLKNRASVPMHLFLEEAHRYVQNDNDIYLIGYNIFDRVAKEGRKYGMILNLISQRPVEISETVISQCSNFLIFKMNHPRDLEYIRQMLPNISAEIVEKQKSLQPGTCVAFGRAFKVPMIVKMQLPNPEPHSSNADVVDKWTVDHNGK